MPRRKWRFRLAALLLSVVIALLMLEAVARWRTRPWGGGLRLFEVDLLPFALVPERRRRLLEMDVAELPYIVPDPETGWAIRPHGAGGNGLYAANALGLRAPREVPAPKPPGVRRILAVGCSLTHGDEVPYEETWCARLEQLLGPPYEVWTGGVPGFGSDQALLRLDTLVPAMEPDLVILAFYRQNLLRNLTFFRSLHHPHTGIPYSKPRFVLGPGDAIELMNVPVVPPAEVAATLQSYPSSPLRPHDRMWYPRLYEHDFRYASRLWRYLISRQVIEDFRQYQEEQLQPGGVAVRLGCALAARFVVQAREQGFEPLILILPDDVDLRSHAPGEVPLMRHAIAALREQGAPLLDPVPEIYRGLRAREDVSALFVGGAGHPNSRCCAEIARILARHLQR